MLQFCSSKLRMKYSDNCNIVTIIFLKNSYNAHTFATPEGSLMGMIWYVFSVWFSIVWHKGPISQIPECTCSISHNAPFRTEMCILLFWLEHCGIWNRWIMGFVNYVNCTAWNHYSEITWASWFKSLAYFFNSFFRLTRNKILKFCITGLLWVNSTSDWWIHLPNG